MMKLKSSDSNDDKEMVYNLPPVTAEAKPAAHETQQPSVLYFPGGHGLCSIIGKLQKLEID